MSECVFCEVIRELQKAETYRRPSGGPYRKISELRVARALDQAFRPRKMNYECLGNTVAHLHWHLFPRYADDPNPMRPIWEHAHAPGALSDADREAVIGAIRTQLG